MSARLVPGAVLALTLAVSTSACGGDAKGEADSAESSGGASASSTPSRSPSPSATPSEETDADLSGTGGRILIVPADSPGTGRCSPAPRRGVVCSADRRTTYRFQPDALRTIGVQRIVGEDDPQNGWQVQVTATPAGRKALASVTGAAARTRQVVLLLAPGGRQLITAPQVNEAITGGVVQISGGLTQDQARTIVRQVTSTDG